MIGNVAEWVLSCLNRIPNTDNYVERSDVAPDDPRTCDQNLAYGGSFGAYAWAWYGMFLNVGTSIQPAQREIGFRVLRRAARESPRHGAPSSAALGSASPLARSPGRYTSAAATSTPRKPR